MKFRSGLLVGLGAGYVLGAKAGRERYQQIVEATRAFLDNPGVQRLTDEVGKTVNVGKERLSSATSAKVEQVSSSLADQANKAKGLVGGESKAGESKTGASKTADEAKAAKSPASAAKGGGEGSSAGASPAGATRTGRPS
jgi:uncharacterized low-complexity protein